MTVADLIAILKKHPTDMEIVLFNYYNGNTGFLKQVYVDKGDPEDYYDDTKDYLYMGVKA